ncbi:MAG: hypothetical protein ACRDNF_15145 [Streptosporangiaceae bacterium]
MNSEFNGDPVIMFQSVDTAECIWANYSDYQSYPDGCDNYAYADMFVQTGSVSTGYNYISVGESRAQNDGALYQLNVECFISGCKVWTNVNDVGYQNWSLYEPV